MTSGETAFCRCLEKLTAGGHLLPALLEVGQPVLLEEKPKWHISVSTSSSLTLLSFLGAGFILKLFQSHGKSVYPKLRT